MHKTKFGSCGGTFKFFRNFNFASSCGHGGEGGGIKNDSDEVTPYQRYQHYQMKHHIIIVFGRNKQKNLHQRDSFHFLKFMSLFWVSDPKSWTQICQKWLLEKIWTVYSIAFPTPSSSYLLLDAPKQKCCSQPPVMNL